MKTVSEVARLLDCVPNTVRNYTATFADRLGPLANPGKGKTRYYSQEDIAVLTVVARMKPEASDEEIEQALDAGAHERVEVPDAPPPTAETPRAKGDQSTAALVPVDLLESFAERLTAQYQGQIDTLEEERNYLRGELDKAQEKIDEAQERVTEAEKRASKLEGKLEALQQGQPPQNAPGSEKQAPEGVPVANDEPRPWWQFWK